MRVIKIGGRAQGEATLPASLAAAWLATPASFCVVHGGGDEISALQRALGVEPRFVEGRRATTEQDIDLVRMALSGTANKRLVSALVSAGARAVGISGEDAALIVAQRDGDARMGSVGTPQTINVELIWHLLDGDYLPVVSPLARGSDGAALNVNGDDAAAAIAVALGADELLLVADVPGVLLADGTPATTLDSDDAVELIATGIAAAGMAAKLRAAASALEGGVARVRIGDIAAITDPHRGTLLTPTRTTV